MSRFTQGLTLIEVMIALGMLALISAAALTAYLSSAQGNQAAALSTRATQLIAAVAGQVNQHALTLAVGASEVRYYSPASFTTPLSAPTSGSNCALAVDSLNYCVVISNTMQFNPTQGGVNVLSTPAELYTIRACWRKRGALTCAEADTIY
ncbi:prepilin-type N-terminal cleavage/methylation domain-containing protein [Deinococcus soli (ex Cha et al. 2016)]|uniref:Prepilin-type N-terminal cleavage/methylation domain-containing protein n=2 Tax=Deinococcus soli (ex Cha et al. 2016) TaxID=1309411 RepID=A0AAE3XFW9_9DEIO|nr:prepilin-type N-terminal cleavage/methylation domain-containing protein [Deinococcus soli (ex Cha et al. 2016)]MDR6218968.1 prepilin-type N-terminal cleavage/methylation domain-containing protein [Deinococcus soli (ex Cha et al. 2016)]MDR6328765.1 prepilin-type N-terminal cleavage/methylation domain-containing protein [Deinococcus soli (ex Cha et al. 2016)]MDR6751748.1 prepilin-type N-terminal cleavage/methylation domain-containing protein [Deinococcus soli (ex Cha et al. 2016)]